MVRAFDAPSPNWNRGHRGVDLAGSPGQPVYAAGAATVVYAGTLAGLAPDDIAGHARLGGQMRVVFSADPHGQEHISLDGLEVSAALRSEAAGAGASRVAAWPAVRAGNPAIPAAG